jgi:hypothetical protein
MTPTAPPVLERQLLLEGLADCSSRCSVKLIDDACFRAGVHKPANYRSNAEQNKLRRSQKQWLQ